jgi:hypothetical protein
MTLSAAMPNSKQSHFFFLGFLACSMIILLSNFGFYNRIYQVLAFAAAHKPAK